MKTKRILGVLCFTVVAIFAQAQLSEFAKFIEIKSITDLSNREMVTINAIEESNRTKNYKIARLESFFNTENKQMKLSLDEKQTISLIAKYINHEIIKEDGKAISIETWSGEVEEGGRTKGHFILMRVEEENFVGGYFSTS
jgi:hypothetical protein